MTAFASLQRASFAGIEFPISSCEVVGGIRDHLHEYPHAPGAAPEKLGRRAYNIHMVGNFQATFRGYPKLWPVSLDRLRTQWEAENTADLVIPTIGTIQAYARSWSQRADAHVQSGETVQVEFVEDQSTNFLITAFSRKDAATLSSQAKKFKASAALAEFQKGSKIGLLDAVFLAANEVIGVVDTAQAINALVVAKFYAAVDLCAQADRLDIFRDPANMQLIEDLHALWAALVAAQDDILRKNNPIRQYIVPATTAVSDISRAIYGDTSHAVELLQLNPIEDAFRVRAGTRLKYYAPDA